MQSDSTEFITSWDRNREYFKKLKLMASLSKLFSEKPEPYLDYRLAENLFCKYFDAENDARSCTAYDARLRNLGIGIKTFVINNRTSTEKIAEFNRLKPQLDGLCGHALARQLGVFRNDRIEVANNTYDVNSSLYHIVGRQSGCLKVFNTPYDKVDIENIRNVVDRSSSISFDDGINEYSFNKSKSVLQMKFEIPDSYVEVPVDIIDNPLDLIDPLFRELPALSVGSAFRRSRSFEVRGVDYVILPLYSTRGDEINVPEKSGLNQWNAGGRRRDENEVYIPVPRSIHSNFPSFFPNRDCSFELQLPDGKSLSAKICQAGGKALMSNPNSALGEWLLRKVLKKKVGELVTINDLNRYGIDSVKIISTHRLNGLGEAIYKIVFSNTDYESYSSFF